MSLYKSLCCIYCLLLLAASSFSKSLNLSRAIEYALEHNQTIMFRARREFKSAEAQFRISQSYLRPNVDLTLNTARSYFRSAEKNIRQASESQTTSPSVSLNYNIPTPLGSQTSLGLGYQTQWHGLGTVYSSPDFRIQYSQPLSLAGIQSGHLEYIRAKKSYIQSQLNFQSTKEDLILQVIRAYFQLWESFRNLEQIEADLKTTRNLLHVAELKLKAGQISEYEVMNTRVQYQDSEDNLELLTYRIRTQQRGFNRLLGVELKTKFDLTEEPRITALPYDSDTAVDLAFKNRLDYKSQLIEMELNQLALKQSQATAFPTLNISGNYSLSSQYNVPFTTALSNFPYRSWNVSATVTIPIYDGGVRANQIQIARNAYDIRMNRFQLFREQMIMEIEERFFSLEMHQKRIKSLAVSLEIAHDAYKAAELRFTEGQISATEIENVRQQYNNKQQAVLNAKIEYMIGSAELARELGVLEQWIKDW